VVRSETVSLSLDQHLSRTPLLASRKGIDDLRSESCQPAAKGGRQIAPDSTETALPTNVAKVGSMPAISEKKAFLTAVGSIFADGEKDALKDFDLLNGSAFDRAGRVRKKAVDHILGYKLL
jgi:hypothetical protein